MLSVFVFITIVQDMECLMSYGVLFRGIFVFFWTLTGLAVLTMPLIYWVSKIHSKLQHIKLNLCPMSTKGLHQYMSGSIHQSTQPPIRLPSVVNISNPIAFNVPRLAVVVKRLLKLLILRLSEINCFKR